MTVINLNMKRYFFNTIYKGFETLDEAKNKCIELNLNVNGLAFIYIFDAFYAVGFEDYNKQCLLNKEYFFYNDNGIWKHRLLRNKYKTLPTLVNKLSYKKINPTIYSELIDVYPESKCFLYDHNAFVEVEKALCYHYYVLLGLYFKEKYYTRDQIDELGRYFKHTSAYHAFFKKYPFILSINPFKQKAKSNEGQEYHYQYIFKNYQTSFEIPRYLLK